MLTPLVLSSALVLAACSQEPDPLAEVPAFSVDVARVNIVEVGTNPQVLRYSDLPADGAEEGAEATTQQYTLDIADGFDQAVVASSALDTQAPADFGFEPTEFRLSAQTTPAPAPGEEEIDATRKVDFTLDGTTAQAPRIQEDLDTANGFLMSWRATDPGRVSTLKLLSPDESEDEGRAAAEAGMLTVLTSNVIFPTEEIGEGGSWTVESRVTGDTTMLRTTTYTVTALSADSVDLDVSIEERPAQATLNFDETTNPELAGQSLKVESSNTSSEGSLTVDFDSPIPVAGGITSTTRVVYAGDQADFRIVQDQGASIQYQS
ncbi:oxidoreductase [Corynebacterium lubricantis]|uniref:oxidoreductase n=1 Tax=Corynebacterium lubricantis TaxID=541095 RepID=UPI001FE19AA1|nr:oxidoreductase [Corynebacterium lubricantis]